MNGTRPAEGGSRLERLGLNPWLQLFLTIIAGTVVAVIAWNIIERFLHIIVLLVASFLVAYLLGPLVDKLERNVPRVLAILLVYLVVIGVFVVGLILLLGPLTTQLQGLVKTLQGLVEATPDTTNGIDRFFREHGIALDVATLRSRVLDYVGTAGASLLGGTLAVAAGLVTFVTDIFLILAITFYLLLDGKAMHNRLLRLLPSRVRERWFFVEATLNRVLGGYIRGQVIVAVTVGVAAGVGSALLGVQYPLVIGLLAFLFEFIPMLGPVLGMLPAVIIAFFQSPTLALWVVVYFIVLQQVESNVIVPRVSGHAVGLHPLAVLLALLAGFEIGGLGGALLSVPLVGVLYVLAMALYMDVTGQTELLISTPRRSAYTSLRHALGRRRQIGGGRAVAVPVTAQASAGAFGASPAAANAGAVPASGAVAEQRSGAVDVASTPAVPATPAINSKRLASIAEDQAQLIAQFEADEAEQAAAEQGEATADAPNKVRADEVP